ncbi:MAG: glycogen debranching protein, partial [Lacibacter sp.]
ETVFMLAGSTNPMQSRLINGVIIVNYTDGSSDKLELKNPENWWPIEQDYFIDEYAFATGAPRPIRLSLKTGEIIPSNYKYTSIKGFANYAIDGGAATILDLSLNQNKQLKNLVVKTIANDVVIGLMSVTLIR